MNKNLATLKQLIAKASSQVHYMSTQGYIDYFYFIHLDELG